MARDLYALRWGPEEGCGVSTLSRERVDVLVFLELLESPRMIAKGHRERRDGIGAQGADCDIRGRR